jgi:hypothetical protein
VAAAYAIQFRPESLLILPVIGFAIWPRFRGDAASAGWWAATLFLWLVAIHGRIVRRQARGLGTAARASPDTLRRTSG